MPWSPNKGGKSPAWFGWFVFPGLKWLPVSRKSSPVQLLPSWIWKAKKPVSVLGRPHISTSMTRPSDRLKKFTVPFTCGYSLPPQILAIAFGYMPRFIHSPHHQIMTKHSLLLTINHGRNFGYGPLKHNLSLSFLLCSAKDRFLHNTIAMTITAIAIPPRNKQNLQEYAQKYRSISCMAGSPETPNSPNRADSGSLEKEKEGRMKKSIYNDRASTWFAVVSEALLLSSFVWLHDSAIYGFCEWTIFFYPYTKWYLWEETNIPGLLPGAAAPYLTRLADTAIRFYFFGWYRISLTEYTVTKALGSTFRT